MFPSKLSRIPEECRKDRDVSGNCKLSPQAEAINEAWGLLC